MPLGFIVLFAEEAPASKPGTVYWMMWFGDHFQVLKIKSSKELIGTFRDNNKKQDCLSRVVIVTDEKLQILNYNILFQMNHANHYI